MATYNCSVPKRSHELRDCLHDGIGDRDFALVTNHHGDLAGDVLHRDKSALGYLNHGFGVGLIECKSRYISDAAIRLWYSMLSGRWPAWP